MKRKLLVVALLVMLVAMLAVSVNAAAEVSGECGDLTWSIDYLNSNHDSTLTITGLGAIPDYTADELAPWHEYREYIKFVNVLGGVSGIGDYAFKDCSTVTRMNLADSVKYFGDHAFDGCSSLSSLLVPSSVKEIGNGAFYNCTSITSVVLPNLIKTIPDDMFYNCSKLTYTNISVNVRSIGNNAFYGCTAMSEMEIPGMISSIGNNAFYGCTGLTEINFKCEVPTFGENVFFGVTATAYYPKNSPTWPLATLEGHGGTITWVEKPWIVNSGTCGSSVNWELDYYGYLRIFGSGDMYISGNAPWYMSGSVIDHIIVDEGVTGLCAGAFKNCGRAQSVTIPASVKTIGSNAFSNAADLTDVYIADLESWLNIEFGNQYSNPLAYNRNDNNLYIGAQKATELVIPASVKVIPDYAFYCCKDITSITFEGDAPQIGFDCFDGLTVTIYYPGNNDTWTEDVMFGHDGNITWEKIVNVVDQGTCGDNVKWVLTDDGMLTISGTGDMKEYTWEDDLPWYDQRDSIKGIIVEDGVTSICGYAFYDSKNLKTVTIGSDVTKIGYDAFWGCGSLQGITIPSNVTFIDGYAFRGCDRMTRVDITDLSAWCRIDFDGDFANPLYYAKNLYVNDQLVTDLVIPEDITAIGDFAFDGSNIKSVTLHADVKSIGLAAFEGCHDLTAIYFKGDAPTFDESIFSPYVVATAYYPVGNETWTSDVMKNYSGTITWESYMPLIASGECSEDVTWKLTVDGVLTISGSGNMPYYGKASKFPWYEHRDFVKSVVIESGITSIASYAFTAYRTIESVTIANTVEMINEGAFGSCSALTEIVIPDSVIAIESDAFVNCSGLKRFTMGNGVTSIGWNAFAECTALEYVSMSNSLESVGDYAFQGCAKLAKIMIPDTVTYIGSGVFYGCGLTQFEIPAGISAISDDMFYDCDNLKSIVIPENITRIGYSAFACCESLEQVTFQGDAPYIGNFAFDDVTLTAYYPADNDSWTNSVKNNYGGTITWEAYTPGNEPAPDPEPELPEHNGLVVVDGVWGYYEGGVLQTEYTGLVPYGDILFYVENGILDFTYTGLVWYNDAWTYVANSRLTQGYTGLVWFNDNWFYTVDSVIDWTFTGLVPYEGNYFYVQNNLLDWSYTGLGYHDGGWYFIQNGLLQKEYSGLVYFNDNWFFVEEGVLTYQYFGMVEYQGNMFYVQASHLDWNYTGLGYHEGNWYYFLNALYIPDYNGLVLFQDNYFYVEDGLLTFQTNGLREFEGKLYYLVDSLFDDTFNGTAEYDGVTYEVVNGVVAL